MLKIANESDSEKIKRFCNRNPFGAYILCRMEAYGLESEFSKIWCGTDESNELVCVVSSLGGNAVILANSGCDYEELSFMISAFGFGSVLTDYETGKRCTDDDISKKEVFCFNDCKCENVKTESEPDFKKVYGLFCSCFPKSYRNDKNSYLSWLSDFMFRKNRNLARIKAVIINEKIISAALTSAECENCAVISSVACDEMFRNQGFGKTALLSLSNDLISERKTVFLISEDSSTSEFYKRTGFKNCGLAAYIERHNNV